MADDKRNIEIKFTTNADETKGKVDKLNKSVEDTAKVTKEASKSTDGLTESVTSNGGAMSILDSVTGGYASRVRDAIEASNLFKKSTDGMTLSQRAYNAVVGTSTGALKTFRLALAATGIGAAIVAIGFLVANWDKLFGSIKNTNKELDNYNKIANETLDNFRKETLQLNTLLSIAQDENRAREDRVLAINELNKIMPEHLRNLTIENINTKEVIELIEKYVKTVNARIKVRSIENAIEAEYSGQRENSRKEEEERERGWLARKYNYIRESNARIAKLNEELVNATIDYQRMQEAVTVDTNKNILNNTQSTNKKIVESEEAKQKRLAELEEARYRLLMRTRDLEIEMIDNPSDKAIAEKKRKLDDLKKSYEDYVKELKNTFDAGETLNRQLKIAEDNYKKQTKEVEGYYSTLFNNLLGIEKVAGSLNQKSVDSINADFPGSYYDGVKTLLDSFDNIEEGALKAQISLFYNIPELRKNFERYQELFTKNREFLENETLNPANNPEDGWVLTSLFGKGGTEEALSKMEKFYEDQRMYLDLQELAAERASETELERTEIKQFYANRRMEIDREEYENNKKLNDLRLKQQLTALDSYSGALDATSQLMGEHTAGHKTLAIASATIDTYTSAVASYKGMVEAIPGPVGIAAGVAAAAASVAMGLNNVKQILSVKVPGGSGSGSGSGGGSNSFNQPNVDFVSSSENQIATTVGDRVQSNNEPIKAYVVASEVSTSQSLERNRIESNSL